MYKDGKQWMFAGIMAIALGLVLLRLHNKHQQIPLMRRQ
ncbi:KxYKxGKxW signal peptide domain-containing protein [Weissella cibaria]